MIFILSFPSRSEIELWSVRRRRELVFRVEKNHAQTNGSIFLFAVIGLIPGTTTIRGSRDAILKAMISLFLTIDLLNILI
jgi:hypothetical protein